MSFDTFILLGRFDVECRATTPEELGQAVAQYVRDVMANPTTGETEHRFSIILRESVLRDIWEARRAAGPVDEDAAYWREKSRKAQERWKSAQGADTEEAA